MKLFKLLLSATIAFSAFSFFGTTLTSCVKQTPIHDTTTLIVKDTITIKDTVIINDTLYDLSKGLVAYYNFNGGSLADSSGLGNNITFNNATLTTDRFGNANNAYLFDGSSSYMVVKNSASINPKNITLYAIVKPNGFFQGQCHGNQILSKGYPYDINGFYSLSFFSVYNGTGGVCSPTVDTTREIFGGEYGDNYPQGSAAGAGNDSIYVQTNQWFTVIYTYDGTTAKLFVNGALVNTNTQTVSFTPNTFDLFIGKHENPLFPYYFNGKIDEIRIYNRAISNQEVGYLNILKNKYLKIVNKLVY